jgi:hypothetical protein
MKKPLVILILLVAGSGAVFPQGQVAPVRPQRRIITKTRLVAIFSDLENQLFQAVQSKDRAGLDSILAEDFQLWTPNPPGGPVPREDWKNQSLAENLKEFQIRQMAARSVEENVTVVSFVLTKAEEGVGKPQRGTISLSTCGKKARTSGNSAIVTLRPLSVVSSRQVRGKPTGKD